MNNKEKKSGHFPTLTLPQKPLHPTQLLPCQHPHSLSSSEQSSSWDHQSGKKINWSQLTQVRRDYTLEDSVGEEAFLPVAPTLPQNHSWAPPLLDSSTMESLLLAQTLPQSDALPRSPTISFTWSKHDTLYLYTISKF